MADDVERLPRRTLRVVLADDQALVRAGLRRILCPEEGFEVVAECVDGASAVLEAHRHRPDLVVMDVRMPVLDGAEATRRIRAEADPPPVLVLTTFGDDIVLSASLRAGAGGFLLKDAPGEEILRAARLVAAGSAYLDPAVTPRVLAAYRAVPAPASRDDLADLTPRELDVLKLVGRGRSNDEIATELGISEATVKTHFGRSLDKLGLRDRASAIVFAFDHGLVAPGGRED